MGANGSNTKSAPVIVLFRQDLRLADNPALTAAAATGRPVLPLYVLDDTHSGEWAMGAASRWWLHGSLASLAGRLNTLGAQLVLRRGPTDLALGGLVRETNASTVYWNRCYEPHAIERDTRIKNKFAEADIDVRSFNANLLFEPWAVKTGAGGPYRVFSPFWRACMRDHRAPDAPLPAPMRLQCMAQSPASDALDDWKLRPCRPDWARGLREKWTPGEEGARGRLASFLDEAAPEYKDIRDFPGTRGTSGLSPHLHFGEIGPRQIYRAALAHAEAQGTSSKSIEKFIAELGWREFAYHLLFHFPTLPDRNYQEKFDDFPWREDGKALHAWQVGRTGYPMVDAGMRELWTTGWMHNRVRMIVASFLVKHLMIHWRHGERWFWDTLVDADLANNAASWQWVAGSGADAAPYFRIFNPVTQGQKFDPNGTYVRTWVPEIASIPDRYVHCPWQAPERILTEAGIALGETYPRPIVDHSKARARALAGFEQLKKAS